MRIRNDSLITRSILWALGYRLGKPRKIGERFYFKRRLTRGGKSRCTIQLQATDETSTVGGWKRGDNAMFSANAIERRIKPEGIAGSDWTSQIFRVGELRSWEEFAFCK